MGGSIDYNKFTNDVFEFYTGSERVRKVAQAGQLKLESVTNASAAVGEDQVVALV